MGFFLNKLKLVFDLENFFLFNLLTIYTYKLRHYANKPHNASTRVTAYTLGISTRVKCCP